MNEARPVSPWVGLYRAAVGLLPPDTRQDREPMVAVFADMLHATPRGRARLRLLLRSFGRLPGVMLLEWLEFLGARPSPGRTDTRRMGMGFVRDLRYAVRTLAKAPAFSASSVLLMAVGVGMATMIFTLVDHVLLRPLPYPEADRLVWVDRPSHSGPFFHGLESTHTVELWSGAQTSDVTLTGVERPRRLDRVEVTEDFFRLFGARPLHGRLLDPEDAGGPPVAVLGFATWRSVWGADPGVVGRTIRLDGKPVTVVGVLAPDFTPPEAMVGTAADLWQAVDWTKEQYTRPDYSILRVAGRLREGQDVAAAGADVRAMVARIAPENPNYREDDGTPRAIPVIALSDATVRGVRQGLGLLSGAVALLLLVACANVAHLFLARGLGRVREMAVRRAMGAGLADLTRQLLAESLVVALVGGVVGSGLAWVGLGVFQALNPEALPRQGAVSLDGRVLAFALAASAATSLVFGLTPALRSVRGELADALRAGGRTATTGRGVTGLRHLLVMGEVALSLVLVASAGLLVHSFVSVRSQDPGFDTADVWTVPLTPTELETAADLIALMDRMDASLRSVPGVERVAHALTMPLEFAGGGRCCWRTYLDTGDPDAEVVPNVHPVSADYFATLGIDLVAGRAWTPAEAEAGVAPIVLGAPLARDQFGDARGALGRTLKLDDMQVVVVGVAADNHHYGLEYEHGDFVYLPFERLPFPIPMAHLAVKMSPGAGPASVAELREAVWAVAPDVPVPTVRSMDEWLERSTAARRFESALFGTFAAVALLLAAGGLYGTLLFVAGERRKELGIRLALGASRVRIESQLLRSGVGVALGGIVVGLAGAWYVTRFLESQIWGVDAVDPASLGMAALILLLTAVVASWLPARRASRTDPLETLRVE